MGLRPGSESRTKADCNPMQSGRVEERSSSSWSIGSKQERRSKQKLLITAGDQKNAAKDSKNSMKRKKGSKRTSKKKRQVSKKAEVDPMVIKRKESSSKKNEKERKFRRETEEPQKTGRHLDQERLDRHR
ncbi:hypothetical protein Tco_1234714 [Tanacetum coccineum]